MIQQPSSCIFQRKGSYAAQSQSGSKLTAQPQFSARSDRRGRANSSGTSTFSFKKALKTLKNFVFSILSLIGFFKIVRYFSELKNKLSGSEQPRALFDPVLSRTTFEQNSNRHTCYLLAGLGALFQHPQGQKILNQIDIRETPDKKVYMVRFPAQPEPIRVEKEEVLNNPHAVHSDYLGVILIEQAYLKIPGARLNLSGHEAEQYDNPSNALKKIFSQSQDIIGHKGPEQQFIGDGDRSRSFTAEHRKAGWQEYLRNWEQDRESVDILTAIRAEGGRHYFIIRLDLSSPEGIVIANPTSSEDTLDVLPIDDFLQTFHIEGIRLPLNSVEKASAERV